MEPCFFWMISIDDNNCPVFTAVHDDIPLNMPVVVTTPLAMTRAGAESWFAAYCALGQGQAGGDPTVEPSVQITPAWKPAIGDVVFLRGHDRPMTIGEIDAEFAKCAWFSESGELQRADFPIAALDYPPVHGDPLRGYPHAPEPFAGVQYPSTSAIRARDILRAALAAYRASELSAEARADLNDAEVAGVLRAALWVTPEDKQG